MMPNIKPVSDLRNYNEVLRDIAVGEPDRKSTRLNSSH